MGKRVKTDAERDLVEMFQTCPGFQLQWYSNNVGFPAPAMGFNWQQGCGMADWESFYEDMFGDWLDKPFKKISVDASPPRV